VAATTSSFDANFCPAIDFFKFGNKKKSHGPNLENMVNGVAVHSPIRPIWPWRGRKCELVRCHDGKALFSSPNGALFSAIRRQIAQYFGIVQHSIGIFASAQRVKG